MLAIASDSSSPSQVNGDGEDESNPSIHALASERSMSAIHAMKLWSVRPRPDSKTSWPRASFEKGGRTASDGSGSRGGGRSATRGSARGPAFAFAFIIAVYTEGERTRAGLPRFLVRRDRGSSASARHSSAHPRNTHLSHGFFSQHPWIWWEVCVCVCVCQRCAATLKGYQKNVQVYNVDAQELEELLRVGVCGG